MKRAFVMIMFLFHSYLSAQVQVKTIASEKNINKVFYYDNIGTFTKGELLPFKMPIYPTESKLLKHGVNEIFSEDFEADSTNWKFLNNQGVWEVGIPSSGPMNSYTGLKCAGTNLSGNYPNNAWDGIYSPKIHIPSLSTSREKIKLKFYNWFELESNYDYGYIYISQNDGQDWSKIYSITGSNYEWHQLIIDLTDYAGQDVFLAFMIGSDYLTNYAGWYIDNIRIEAESTVEWIVNTGYDLDIFGGWSGNLHPGWDSQVYNPPMDFDIIIGEDVSSYQNFALIISAFDVDVNGVGDECTPGFPEVDNVYFNGYYVGKLTGADNSWSISTFEIKKEWINSGTIQNPGINKIEVYIDVLGKIENCEDWAAKIDWAALSPINSSTNGVGFSTTYYDSGTDVDGNGKFDFLDITVTVNVESGNSGNFNMNGVLKTHNGSEITWATKETYLTGGLSDVILRFSGTDINAFGVDGPYYLKNTTIYNTNNPNINGWVIDAYTTNPYLVNEFELSQVQIPHVIQKIPDEGARVDRDTIIQAIFNVEMLASTLNSNTFQVKKDGIPIEGTVSYNHAEKICSFAPKEKLDYGEQYQVIISTDVKALDGTPLSNVETWSFTVNNKIPVIVIPGIMGSPLYDSQNNNFNLLERIWVNKTATLIDPFDLLLFNLRLDESGTAPSSDSYNIQVSPQRNSNRTIEDELSLQPLDSYSGIINYLINSLDYKLDPMKDVTGDENLFCFVYDWRKSNSSNGNYLNDFINNICLWTKSEKVNIIAHSMGGLVTKSCIANNPQIKNKIDKIIFLGTPHLGAPKMHYVALTGNFLGGLFGLFFNNATILDIIRNMPSTYQLLPSSFYLDENLNNGYSANSSSYGSYFSYDNENYDYGKTRNSLKNNNILGTKPLNSFLIDRAEEYQSAIMNVDFSDVEVFNIVGSTIPTIGKIRSNFWLIRKDFSLLGDGTVPLKSAEIIGYNKKLAERTYYLADVKHQDLPSDEAVLEIINGILSDPPKLNDFTNSKISYSPPSNYVSPEFLQAEAACPVVLHAYDEYNNHTGPTSDSTWEANIPGSYYIPSELSDTSSAKIILLPPGGNYRYELLSQGYDGKLDLYFDYLKNGEAVVSIGYENVDIGINTIAEANVNTLDENTTLDLDIDGDGTVDQIKSPTLFTSADERTWMGKIPENFLLFQNYPNPFNPITTIAYQVPVVSYVKLIIIDMLGRQVEVLVNEVKPAGNYSINFNGTTLASGVYFYQLQAGNFSQTKKLMLIK